MRADSTSPCPEKGELEEGEKHRHQKLKSEGGEGRTLATLGGKLKGDIVADVSRSQKHDLAESNGRSFKPPVGQREEKKTLPSKKAPHEESYKKKWEGKGAKGNLCTRRFKGGSPRARKGR